MDATLGTVHATALGAVAVVEQFCDEARQLRSFLCTEHKRGHGGAVLSEVYDEVFTLMYGHLFARFVFTFHHHLAILVSSGAFYVFPDVCLDGLQREVGAQIDFRAVGGEHLSAELAVEFGFWQLVGVFENRGYSCVVVFSVKYGGVGHGPGYACLPICRIGGVGLLRTVDVGQLQHASERTFLTNHAVVASGGYYLVCPPAWRHLYGEQVVGVFARVDERGYVVGERPFGLGVVGESGFQYLVADTLAVDIQVVNAKSRGHPFGFYYLLWAVLHGAYKPTGAVGGTCAVFHSARYDWCIGCRNPFGGFPIHVV